MAALFMNIYIVGLNQLFDIEIDKVSYIDCNLKCFSSDFIVLLFIILFRTSVGANVGDSPG